MEVVERIVNSMLPKRASPSYLKNNLGKLNFLFPFPKKTFHPLITDFIKIAGVNPDMYGPIWVTLTLIFTIAISGNLANFFQHDHNSTFVWHYNFHLVSYATTCIYLYVCIMPFTIWSLLKYSVDLTDDSNPDLESVS
jgi:hypothetical protein